MQHSVVNMTTVENNNFRKEIPMKKITILFLLIFSLFLCSCNNGDSNTHSTTHTENTSPQKITIDNPLYVNSIEELKEKYNIGENVGSENTVLVLNEKFGDINGDYYFFVENKKIVKKQFLSEYFSYYKDDTVKEHPNYDDLIKLEKDNLDVINQKFKSVYETATNIIGIESFTATPLDLNNNIIADIPVKSYEEFNALINELHNTDIYSTTDRNKPYIIHFTGSDANNEYVLNFIIKHSNRVISMDIEQLTVEN